MNTSTAIKDISKDNLSFLQKYIWITKFIIGSLFILAIIFFTINGTAYLIQKKTDNSLLKDEEMGNIREISENLSKKNKKNKKILSSFFPKGNYLVIDTAKNILYVKKGSRILYQAIVSTGSGKLLIDPHNKERRWVFDTPRGEFSIRGKIAEPTWIKPDWAFIEEGMDIPKNYNDRFEEGVLGDYALDIGNGYFIHGTLYTRLLGKSVTHGCIRIDNNDLKTVYNASRIETKVYIF